MRKPPCPWLGVDENGRPFCEHGPAFARGKENRWRCRQRGKEADRRYSATMKGREAKRRSNASEHARSVKQLYELTRVRVTP